MKYPAKLTPDEEAGGFVITFRDIPEAITQGDTEEEALSMAADVLLSSMDFYFDDKRPVPSASQPQTGERMISLPVSVAAKVLLLNEMLAQNVRPSELAKRLGASRQAVNRIIDLHHATKIDQIASALLALGRDLNVVI